MESHVVFGGWLSSLSMMFSRFSQTAAGASTGSCSRLCTVPLWGHHVSVLCSSVDGHWECFHFLVIMRNVAVNIPVQVFVWTYVSSALGFILRCGLAGACGNSGCTFMKNCQTVVRSGCTLYVPPAAREGSFLHILPSTRHSLWWLYSYIFFGEVSAQQLCLFLNWVIWLFELGCLMYEFCIIYRRKPLIRCMMCRYHLPFYDSVLWSSVLFILMKSSLFFCCLCHFSTFNSDGSFVYGAGFVTWWASLEGDWGWGTSSFIGDTNKCQYVD